MQDTWYAIPVKGHDPRVKNKHHWSRGWTRFVFVEWEFCSLVSVSVLAFQSVIAVCCLVRNVLWTCFHGLLSWCFPRVCLMILEAWIIGWVGGEYCDQFGGGTRKEKRPQQVFCWGWVWRSRRRVDPLLICLLPVYRYFCHFRSGL